MTKFIAEILIKSVIIYGMMYVVQLVKYAFIGDVNPTLVDLCISIGIGLWLSNIILKKLNVK